ncbi:MAG: hypothetical protein ACTSVI_08700 [Promethearchaeota archaeon]
MKRAAKIITFITLFWLIAGMITASAADSCSDFVGVNVNDEIKYTYTVNGAGAENEISFQFTVKVASIDEVSSGCNVSLQVTKTPTNAEKALVEKYFTQPITVPSNESVDPDPFSWIINKNSNFTKPYYYLRNETINETYLTTWNSNGILKSISIDHEIQGYILTTEITLKEDAIPGYSNAILSLMLVLGISASLFALRKSVLIKQKIDS